MARARTRARAHRRHRQAEGKDTVYIQVARVVAYILYGNNAQKHNASRVNDATEAETHQKRSKVKLGLGRYNKIEQGVVTCSPNHSDKGFQVDVTVLTNHDN